MHTSHSPVDDEHSSTGLPHLPNDAEHAYHLVVMYVTFLLSHSLGYHDSYHPAPAKNVPVSPAFHSASAQVSSWVVETRRRIKTEIETAPMTSANLPSRCTKDALQSPRARSLPRIPTAGLPFSRTFSFTVWPSSALAHARGTGTRIPSWDARPPLATLNVA